MYWTDIPKITPTKSHFRSALPLNRLQIRLDHFNLGVKNNSHSLVIAKYKHKPPWSSDTINQFLGNESICLPSATDQVICPLTLVGDANVVEINVW